MLSWRFTRSHPEGAVIVTVLGRTAMEATSASPLAVPVGLVIVIDAPWPLRSVEAPLRKAMAASEAAGSSRHATARRAAQPSSIRERDRDLTGGCERKPDAEPGHVLRPRFIWVLQLTNVTILVSSGADLGSPPDDR